MKDKNKIKVPKICVMDANNLFLKAFWKINLFKKQFLNKYVVIYTYILDHF